MRGPSVQRRGARRLKAAFCESESRRKCWTRLTGRESTPPTKTPTTTSGSATSIQTNAKSSGAAATPHESLLPFSLRRRNTIETQLGDPDRTHSSYFDPQYIGAIDAFPYADFTHKTYTWRLHWIPYLALTYFKGDAPIRSPIFSLAGVDPLQVGKVCSRSTSGAFWVFVAKKNFVGCEKGVCAQLWFYPAGSGDAPPGFCSVKLVSRPGWHLPFKIKVWARGASAISSQQREALLKAVRKLAPSREGGSEAGDGRASEEHNPRTLALAAVEAAAEPSQVCVGPCWREEANYVAGTTAFCRWAREARRPTGDSQRAKKLLIWHHLATFAVRLSQALK